jgi:tetratricopeptide (TPR) repeat protein
MAVAKDTGLRDVEIAITGRLASMSRQEAIDAIRRHGGRYAEEPRRTTTVLVIGSDGPPLAKDGHPTKSLRRAKELQRAGTAIEIVDEEELLARLGEQDDDELPRLYTIVQLGRILDIETAEIRSWIRADLIRPTKIVKRLCFFDFRQVASARRLQQLTRSGISPARIRRSLEQLTSWIPGAVPALAQLEVLENGGHVLVRLENGRLAETNGQLRLDFEASRPDADATPTPTLQPRKHSAEDWFNLGIAAEESGNLEGAVEAYQNAMTVEDPQPEVCFNLGNTYYAMGRNVEAAACFIRATEVDAEYVEAWNNLGNALTEIGRHDQAIPAYKQALAIEPSYADAHYNLGETLALLNDVHGAARHWVAYLKQDPNSPWAHRVRTRLAELS